MAYRDLRDFLARLDELGELHRVAVEVDPHLEIAAVTDRACKLAGGGPALLFEWVKGSGFPVATNLFGSEQRVAAALGFERTADIAGWMRALLVQLPGDSAMEKLSNLRAHPAWQEALPVTAGSIPCREIVEARTDLSKFPFLKSWPCDGFPDHDGRFITLPQVISRDPQSGELNCGMYRVALLGRDRVGVHWGPNSGAAAHAAAWQRLGKPMPVNIVLGGPPALAFSASLPLPPALDEFTFAGLLQGAPLEIAGSLASDLPVPAGAELVIEGIVEPGEMVRDGSFGNHTGYYAAPADVPLVRVTSVSRRSDMIYPATVVGRPPMEDCWLAVAAGRILLALLQVDFPEIGALHQPLAGIFHGGTVISVRKDADGAVSRLLAGLRDHSLIRHSRLLILVDAVQDPADLDGVYWRVMNNVVWTRDLVFNGGQLAVDATCKLAGVTSGEEKRLPVEQDRSVENMVSQRWREYGFNDCT